MLACDLLMNVRASRTISGEQVTQLERMVFADGGPSREQLDLLCLIDTYLERPHPGWAPLFSRATLAALGPRFSEDRTRPPDGGQTRYATALQAVLT
jgi:hypothetical protein